jgi:hypothetical protein
MTMHENFLPSHQAPLAHVNTLRSGDYLLATDKRQGDESIWAKK